MRRNPALVSLLAGLSLGGVLLMAGCRQSSGDRCEVSNDCESGLVCSLAARTGMGRCCVPGTAQCTSETSPPDGGLDAATGGAPTDATVVTDGATDASTDVLASDAPTDAPADLATDLAAPLPDASSN
jgi:hypothetical protein